MTNMKQILAGTAIALCGIVAHASDEYFVKELIFPEGTDSITKVEMAARLVPNEQQRAWQQRELTAFLHFGMNTFTDREWGDGKESPELFNPDSLDTDQWVSALKDAGFKMVILTAKHHDGFCLWPTATTDHSVASSPWRGGKGDVVADLRKSCDKYGMKLGIYLSPWDRNASCYGDSPRYNDMFVAQLTELLTNYGKIDEVWFDGACGEGPNGKKQEYDWLRFRETMRRLQPEAVLAITGDDVRWVGNEGGRGRETEWSVTPLVPSIYSYSDSINKSLGIDAMSPGIGSRELVAKADRLYWWPSEGDVSIRPGWFYHSHEKPHSLSRLADIYLQSVGRNSVLLLNIPPDRSGRINQADVNRLMEMRRWIDQNFTDNLLGTPSATINSVVLEEDIDRGQRVEQFEILGYDSTNDRWTPLAQGTTIGKKRILTFPDTKVDALRLKILSSRSTPHARITGAYHITMPQETAPATIELPSIPTKGMKLTTAKNDGNFIYTIRMPKATEIAGFVYTPEPAKGLLFKYAVQSSLDGKKWTDIATTGEFSNVEANPIPQQVVFETPVKARYFRLRTLETIGNSPMLSTSTLTLLSPKQ